jgi:hypothetical protein
VNSSRRRFLMGRKVSLQRCQILGLVSAAFGFDMD